MVDHNMRHLDFIRAVAEEDLRYVNEKDRQYGGSWKRRGGIGAFMMLARKWDRLETMLAKIGRFGGGDSDAPEYDIFRWIECEVAVERRQTYPRVGSDGTVLAEVRDLRRYLMLVEAEMLARGVFIIPPTARSAPLEDSNKHAERVADDYTSAGRTHQEE